MNFSNEAKCKVNFNIKTIDPKSFVKRINILTNVRIYHIFDVEATDHEYTERFKATLKNMKDAEKLGKNIKYINGYSNLTFEIWIILHMSDCNKIFSHRKNYLDIINKIFNKNYKSLQEFKEEKHFKEILEKNISLNEVKNAIRRMTLIMQSLEKNKNQLETYQGYSWYLNNPSSNLGKIIAEIFFDCGIGF